MEQRVCTFEPLRSVLQANAAFSGISGVSAMIWARPLAALLGIETGEWMGWSAPQHIFSVGLSLVLFSIALLWMSFQRPIPLWQVQVVIALDVAWVLASVAIVLFQPISLTLPGSFLVFLLAMIVSGFAALQRLLSKQAHRGPFGLCAFTTKYRAE